MHKLNTRYIFKVQKKSEENRPQKKLQERCDQILKEKMTVFIVEKLESDVPKLGEEQRDAKIEVKEDESLNETINPAPISLNGKYSIPKIGLKNEKDKSKFAP